MVVGLVFQVTNDRLFGGCASICPPCKPRIHSARPDMRPSEALKLYRDQIRTIALKNRVTNPRVFGSVLRNEDTEESDLDILVEPTQYTTLTDIARIQVELMALLNVSVDVLTPRALPEKFRQKVIGEALPI